MRRLSAPLLAAALATIGAPAAAQQALVHDALGLPDDLALRINLRGRFEAIGGQFRSTGPHRDRLFSLRTDIFAEYHTGRLRIAGELRDARGYGEKRDSSAGVSEINTLEPLQAYVGLDLKDVGGKGGGGLVLAGRYTLELGVGRQIGKPDFANSINSYTGVLLDWHDAAKDRLVLFANEPSLRVPSDTIGLHDNRAKLDRARGGFRFFGGFASSQRLLPGLSSEAYVYALAERDAGDQLTRNRHLRIYGARVQRAPKAGTLDFEVEAIHQGGTAHATTAPTDRRALPVSAQLVHAEVGTKLKGPWAIRLSLHGDLATGDDRDPDRYTRFDPLFSAARADWGPTGLFGALNRTNIRSVGVRAEAAPGKRVDAFVMVRETWLDKRGDAFAATGVRDRTGGSGRYAGTQVETRLRYWLIPKRLKTDVGGAYLAKARFLRDAPNAPPTGDSRYLFIDLAADI